MNNTIRGVGLVLGTTVLLVLAGCVTPGNYGSVPGGGYDGRYDDGQSDYGQPAPDYSSQYGSQLQGTVEAVAPGYNRIVLFVDDPRTGRSQQTEVRYDQGTRLFYQGRERPLEGLERGDVIRMDVTKSDGDIWAREIEVVSNVRDETYGGGYPDDRYGGGYQDDRYSGGYGDDLRGSVAFVDTRARLIRLDGGGYGNNIQLAYDARTTVEYQRRAYRPENLQRGDIVRIQARQVGNNQWLAERIIVERSVGR